MLSVASLACYLVLVVFLPGLYLALTRFWWGETGRTPLVHHRADSRLCQAIIRSCSTLTERYTPPLLWGRSGHVQTIIYGFLGWFLVPTPQGERRSLSVPDGSTVTYNFYGPEKPSPIIYLLCPGIGNSCETCYVRAFVHQVVASSYSVAVLNHIGTLRDSPLTGNRLFTYGGTGDLAAVFEDLLSRYPSSQFVLVGFSLGANIAVRFIGERVAWRRHLLCAVSVCQGYDPNQAIRIFPNISPMSKVYGHRMISVQLSLIRYHRSSLVGETSHKQLKDPSRRHSDVTHAGHDCNGFALDVSKISPPNERLLWSARTLHELDEYYTRRVLGFQSVPEMWQWMACVDLMRTVTDFPLLLVNARDDPIVPQEVHSIPLQYTDLNPYAMFVSTEYGGHLGFLEGGLVLPNWATWLQRLVLQYTQACSHLLPKMKLQS
jgi:abhydrolase domain-containing protein 2